MKKELDAAEAQQIASLRADFQARRDVLLARLNALQAAVERDYRKNPFWTLSTVHQSKGRECTFNIGIATNESIPTARAITCTPWRHLVATGDQALVRQADPRPFWEH